MILSCQNISVAFDGKDILKNISFHIEEREKAALIGVNGAGKTTLLNIITGRISADEGEVVIAKDKTLGYLEQHPVIDSDNTIYEELMSVKSYLLDLERQIRDTEHEMKTLEGEALEACMNRYSSLTAKFESENGYAYKSELTGVLRGLGFTDEEFEKKVNTLSGGQKTRVALGKILLLSPDIILLDEPTNHLDLNAISWLENYLLNYKGAILIVSHDRYFLNRISQKVIEIDQASSMSFQGNYSEYAAKKEMVRAARLKAYLNQQREIKHQQDVIDKLKSFNREKSIKRAESREKMLDKIERIEKPTEVDTEMKLTLTPRIESGKDVLTVEHLSKAFPTQTLFTDLNFACKRGEHVAIIGDNGTGKTTLLKIINGLTTADAGEVKIGTKVTIGYYDQEHHVLHPDKTIYDELADDYPSLTVTEIRNCLAAFLFTGDDVYKLIKECSGGERGRISLAKLMLSEANFLILDEPTNHLDIESKEILENALNSYEGTVLYVSHDRYFINQTAHRILELTSQDFTSYLGNYDYYLEKKEAAGVSPTLSSDSRGVITAEAETVSDNKLDWQAQKEKAAQERKRQNELEKTEKRIAELEDKIKSINEEMCRPDVSCNVGRLAELSREQEKYKTELEGLYERWEELA